ncbi:MAG: hypothetical protein PHZ24_05655 [Bacteroidales bacterium]|nr:hypothetical protein [Bacteroidales bacterium]MDY0140657.1 hypothetical protein [Bacteroidales bacterium]
MDKTQKDFNLLPPIFKKIAFGIILIVILFVILNVTKVLRIDKQIAKTITMSFFLIALLLLAITKNKIEDELTLRIRLKAFAASFLYGVAFVIVKPFVNLLFDGTFLLDMGVEQLLLSMFFFYFIMMFIMKRSI